MLKTSASSTVVAALLAWAGLSAGAEVLDGVAAIVNDKVITYSEVRQFVQPVVQQLTRNYAGKELIEQVRKAQLDALNQLIERALIIQEFKTKGYSIPETVIDQQINDTISEEYGGNRATFVKTLEAQNLTLSQYREKIRERVIIQAMRGHKTQQAVVVSPYKIERYYNDNIEQYQVDDQIKLRMIFIKRTPKSEESEPKSESETNATEQASLTDTNQPPETATPDPQRELADEILSKLDAGESFESMARVYSEGREAKAGGDWGWIGKDVLRKELNATAFSLKPGEHSRVIDTAEGYYILQVDDVKPAHTTPLADVRDEIERVLLQKQRAEMQEQWVSDLRAKAYIRLF